jgi:hypothetical protein
MSDQTELPKIERTQVNPDTIKKFTFEDEFVGLSVDLLIETGSWICIAGNLFSRDTRSWNHDQGTLYSRDLFVSLALALASNLGNFLSRDLDPG